MLQLVVGADVVEGHVALLVLVDRREMPGNRLVSGLRLFLGEMAVIRDVRLLEALLHGQALVRRLGAGRLGVRGQGEQRQGEQFWMFAKISGMGKRFVPPDPRFDTMMRSITLEAGLIVGAALALLGLALRIYAISTWGRVAFGNLVPEQAMRLVIPSGTAILLGFHIAYGALFVSVLGIGRKR